MSIGSLIVEFEARTGKFETDTGRAAKIMEKRAREIDAQVRKIGTAVGAAVGAAAVGLGVLVKNAIDTADKMDKLAQKTGITIEAISQLSYAAKLSDVEDLGASLVKFNKSVGDAAQGTKAQAEAFKELGVNIRNADGTLKDTETLFTATAEAISKLPDGIKKTQLAVDLFGKSGAQLIPFLNEGKAGLAAMRKEADDLGLTLDERTGKAADGFNDNLDKLGAVTQGVGTRLATQLAPELERLTGLLVDTAKSSDAVSRAADGVGTVFKGLTLIVVGLSNGVQIVVKSLVGLAGVQGLIFSGNFSQAIAYGKAALEDIGGDIDDVTKAYDRLFGAAGGSLPSTPKPRGSGDTIVDEAAAGKRQKALDEQAAKAKAAAKAIEDYIAALQEEAATNGISREQIERRKLSLMGANAEQIQQASELTKYIGLQEAAAKADEERARIFEQTRTSAEQYAATIERLNILFDNGAKDPTTYRRAVDQATKAFDDARDAANKATDSMSVFAEQAARNMQDAFADFLFNPFEEGLKGMVRNFAIALQRMAANALAAGIFEKLTGGASGQKSGGGGGILSGLIGAAVSYFSGAGATSATGVHTYDNVGFRASGGPVGAGMPYIVGERGPELMVPKAAGSIVPNEMLGGKQQNIRIVNAFDTSVIGDYMQSAAGEQSFLNLASRNGVKLRNLIQNG